MESNFPSCRKRMFSNQHISNIRLNLKNIEVVKPLLSFSVFIELTPKLLQFSYLQLRYPLNIFIFKGS
jgi:hypothetical protein